MNRESIKEWLVFFGIFSAFLFPLRFIFNEYLHEYWFGSLGVLSIVTFILFYLSSKKKLGYVGFVIKKRLIKRSQGKAFKMFVILSGFIIYLFSLTSFGILEADKTKVNEDLQKLKKQGVTDFDSMNNYIQNDKDMSDPVLWLQALSISFTPSPITFEISYIMNQFTHGYLFSISSIILVEECEFLGIVLFFRFSNIKQGGITNKWI